MEGRINTILMCVKFDDDPISSLDFSFTGGVYPLTQKFAKNINESNQTVLDRWYLKGKNSRKLKLIKTTLKHM